MRKLILFILPVLLLTGCFHVPDNLSSSATIEVKEMDFTTLEQSTGSYTEAAPQLFLVQSQVQLDQLWDMYVSGNILNPSPAPQIDFNGNFILAAFAGQKSTGGYSFEITGINTNDAQSGTSDVAVYATLQSPAPGTTVTQALTSPFHVVQVKRQAGFQFEDVYMILTDEQSKSTQIVSVNQTEL
ncbi:MAG: protease complex subunit PrcB family protein [Patescibacteria group bacterium]